MLEFLQKNRLIAFLLLCVPLLFTKWFQVDLEVTPQYGINRMFPFILVATSIYGYSTRLKFTRRVNLIVIACSHLIIIIGMLVFFLFWPRWCNITGEISIPLSFYAIKPGFIGEAVLVILHWILSLVIIFLKDKPSKAQNEGA